MSQFLWTKAESSYDWSMSDDWNMCGRCTYVYVQISIAEFSAKMLSLGYLILLDEAAVIKSGFVRAQQ